ncbi:MAG: PASTA domain-containing protein [Acidimicrobiia bacterium]|nr:PASTA domain-containing protein [Acidimicrobiia bacterium]
MAVSGVADLAGRVLAGRYRLRAPIGTGASGRVYLADDVQLRRRVAVKVLHAALADDAGFLRRFRSEAQLAASLHHPNVMTVHDWGEDGVPFMVLELLEGGSLRAMLDHDVRLSPAQAAHVGREVCAALEYAHTRGLVHRDIKPANLLFDEHGIVRVADFGLARALAEASWTEPAGAVLGTARYASPEQAKGTPVDARSDLYALALVLVEAVTGRVPFVADTPIGTLAARTQRPLVAPPELGPLGAVVERAGRPDPAERYPDAATMGAALADAAAQLPVPGPLTLVGHAEVAADPHPTELGGLEPSAVYDQDSDTAVVAEVPPARARRRRGFPVANVVVTVLLALALAAAGIAVAAALDSPALVTAPDLVGRTQADAAALASEAGLLVEVVERRSADDPSGVVVDQRPGAGRWLHDGDAVELVVSRGPPPVEVPDVRERPALEAVAVLDEAGFVLAPAQTAYHETIPLGAVISQDPEGGTEAARDSVVALVISDGPAPVPVPPVAGLAFEQAAQAVTDAGLTPLREDVFSDAVEAGLVVGAEPAEGTEVERGSEVKVLVSKGPELLEVPDVVGSGVEEATETLEGRGFDVDVENYRPGRSVRAQDPQGGEMRPRGTTITLFL